MTQPESQQIRGLRSVSRTTGSGGSKDLVRNLSDLNAGVNYLSQMLIVTQKGVDDANKDILAKVQDAIDELIILFTGGSGTFDWDWDGITAWLETLPFIGDIVKVFTGLTDGTMDDLSDWVGGWNRVHASNAGKITQIENLLASGATFSDDFNRDDNLAGANPLGSNWVQGGAGQALGIIDNAARIDNPLVPVGVVSGRRYAICQTVPLTNDVVVSTVVNPKGVAQGAMTTIILRSNAAMTEFVYVNIYGKSCYLGRGTRSGTTWTFGVGGEWDSNTIKGVTEGATVDSLAVGTSYEIRVNGEVLLNYTDTAGAHPVDSTHRHVGFASETKMVALLPQYSWGLAAFAHRPPTVADFGAMIDAANAATDQANAAQQSADETRAALDEFIAAQEATAVEGNLLIDNFVGRPNGVGIGGDWTQVPNDGQIGVQDGKLGYLYTGEDHVTRCFRNTQLTSDDHYARISLSGPTWTNECTTIYVRANAARTSYVFAKIFEDRIIIGTATGGTETDRTTATLSVANGNTVELRAVGNLFTILINGVVRYTYSYAHTMGAGYRGTGVAFMRHKLGFLYWYSPSIRLFLAGDYSPPTFIGVGWSMSRRAASEGSVSSTSSGAVNYVSVMDTLEPETKGVTVLSLPSGEVQIITPGWYQIDNRAYVGYLTGGHTMAATIQRAAAGGTPSYAMWRHGSRIPVTYTDSGGLELAGSECSALIYLQAGERVAPGIYRSAGTTKPTGDPSGSYVRFSGTLISAIRGPQGEQGPQGVPGIQGPIGEGLQFDYIVANAAALPSSPAELSQAITNDTGKVYLYKSGAWIEGPVVRGPQGIPGNAGPSNVLSVGTVTTGIAGSSATVTISGTSPTQVIDFAIPRGATGNVGPQPPLVLTTTLPGSGTVGTIYWIAE